MNSSRYIGMISGTSRDGVDAALVNFEDGKPVLQAAVCIPYPAGLAESLARLVGSGRRPGKSAIGELDSQLADHFSKTVMLLLGKARADAAEIAAIGSHGQTVWHEPDGPEPVSIQLGDPCRIAKKTGIVTVGDFRAADIEAGGQGAPLAPLLHRALFCPPPDADYSTRIVLNLGGIANISILGKDGKVSGFDTGPANCLLDAWIQNLRGEPFDRDGNWSAGGSPDPGLLEEMLNDPYFVRAAPKSTGIEYFNASWLERHLHGREISARDVQTSLAELSARTAADAIRPNCPAEVLVCGGGAHNRDLLARLGAHLPETQILSTASEGLDPDWVEAVLFAWLAHERLMGRAQDTGSVTGARNPVLLGMVADPFQVV